LPTVDRRITRPTHPGGFRFSLIKQYYIQITLVLLAFAGSGLLVGTCLSPARNLQYCVFSGLLLALLAALAAACLVRSLSNRLRSSLSRFVSAAVAGNPCPADALPELSPLLTALQERTRSLAESEENFRKVFAANPSMLSIRSLPERRYLAVNDSFLRVTGFARDEVISRTIEELDMPFDPVTAELKQVTESGKTYSNAEIRFRTKQGRVRTGLSSTAIVELGGVPCVVTATKDITELRELEQELARFDRLNLVGRMAAGIGHEIRNPLTTIRGFLQILAQNETEAGKLEYFDIMLEEIDQANLIISEFLSLAKDKANERKAANLNDIIASLLPLLRADAAARGHTVGTDFGELPDAYLDAKEIRQLLLNLARNGFEAMPEYGCLTIRTRQEAGEVILAVADTGCGIDPAIRARLGHPFVTTKENGTGLGLAICYQIAGRHHASIAYTTGDNGTTFTVRFPAATAGKQPAS